MRVVCNECGSEIPEGADFCYKCGAKLDHAMKIDEDGSKIYSNRCFNCGADISPGDQFCQQCGKPVSDSYIALKRPRPTKMGLLAIFLAFIPGLLDIFGLGQLVLKRWSKGIAFLAISMVLFYLSPAFSQTQTGLVMLLCVRLFVFFLQISDVFNAVYRGDA